MKQYKLKEGVHIDNHIRSNSVLSSYLEEVEEDEWTVDDAEIVNHGSIAGFMTFANHTKHRQIEAQIRWKPFVEEPKKEDTNPMTMINMVADLKKRVEELEKR